MFLMFQSHLICIMTAAIVLGKLL